MFDPGHQSGEVGGSSLFLSLLTENMQEQPTLQGEALEALMTQYNHEIDRLKSRMLLGESWEALYEQRSRITTLAQAIHQQQLASVS